jgi:hypothetical protein
MYRNAGEEENGDGVISEKPPRREKRQECRKKIGRHDLPSSAFDSLSDTLIRSRAGSYAVASPSEPDLAKSSISKRLASTSLDMKVVFNDVLPWLIFTLGAVAN